MPVRASLRPKASESRRGVPGEIGAGRPFAVGAGKAVGETGELVGLLKWTPLEAELKPAN